MKILKFTLLIFFSFNAFAASVTPDVKLEKAVRSKNISLIREAIQEGAANVDIVLKKELNGGNFNYDIVKMLTENSAVGGVDRTTMNSLCAKFIREICNNSDKNPSHEKFLDNIHDFATWDYEIDEKTYREITDNLAFRNDDESTIVCVMRKLAKMSGDEKFLEVAMESAEKYKSENLKNVVLRIRSEIAELKLEQ